MQAMTTNDNTSNLSLIELVAAMQYMPVGVTIVERSLTLRFWNEAFCRLLDFPPELMRPGVSLEDIFKFNAKRGEYGPGDPAQQVKERMELTLQFQPHQFVRTRPNGTVLDVSGRVIYDEQGEMTGFVTLYRDLTFEKRQEQQVKAANKELVLAYDDLKHMQTGSISLETDAHKHYQLAVRDPLTGLFNRYYLEDAADNVIRMHEHNQSLRHCLLTFTVDRFADINEQYGRVGGEVVMRRVGAVLARESTRFNLAAPCGAGRFAIFVADAGADDCQAYAERVREAVRAIRFEQTMSALCVGVSAAIIERRSGEAFSELISRGG